MIEKIKFETVKGGRSEIHLQHDTGETTILLFGEFSPVQEQERYLKSIRKLIKTHPDMSPGDNGLLGLFTWWLSQKSLETPIGIRTCVEGERQRIGQLLRNMRKGLGMSAARLAMLSGISPAVISNIEKGKHSVTIDTLSKLANTMGYKIDFYKMSE